MAVIALSVFMVYRLVNDFFYPDLHFMHKEFEDTSAPWNNTVPGYLGFGYVRLESEVCWVLLLYTLYVFLRYIFCVLFH